MVSSNYESMTHEDKTARREKWLGYGEWIWRLLIMVGICGLYWLRSQFVSLAEYQTDRDGMRKSIEEITRVLAIEQERDKVNDRQDEQLKDHETRLRILENRR